MSTTTKRFLKGFGLGGLILAGAAGACCLFCDEAAPPPAPPAQASPAATVAKAEAKPEAQEEEKPAWLKKAPGVVYKRPKRVPELLYKKYQSFEESFDTVQSGSGEFVTSGDKTAYKIVSVSESSALGLRPGDKVIAVNGQPVGRTFESSKTLFEALKGESKVLILIEREGKTLVIEFSPGQ